MNLREKISEQELRRLYLDEHWTQEEIAEYFGVGATTIKRRLQELGIEIRARGPEPGGHNDFRFNNPEWSAALAYVVGVITSDGNLSPDARHISIKSKDLDLLETCKQLLGLENRIGIEHKLFRTYYRLTWGNRAMYDWLMCIGLMPAKSDKLREIAIPSSYLPDFVRGAIDGDGSIQVYTDRWNTHKNEKYIYERLFVLLVSASFEYLKWLHHEIQNQIPVRGALLTVKQRPGRKPTWILKFAKQDSITLLNWLYYAPEVPCLKRKYEQAKMFLSRD